MKIILNDLLQQPITNAVHIFAKSVDFNIDGVLIKLNDTTDVDILKKAGYTPFENEEHEFVLKLSLKDFIGAINVIQNG